MPLARGLEPEHADELIEEFAKPHFVARQIQPPRLDLGNIQNAVDQAGEVIGAAADDADLVARLGV